MTYTIQQTKGIKAKLYSIYQEGVKWVRSLFLLKAKKRRNKMARVKRTKYVNLLLSDNEKEKLEKYAEQNQQSLNEVLRGFIRALPD